MKRGTFDLKGKAIYCSGLLDLDEAGEEIFRALKVAIGCEDDDEIDFHSIVWCEFIFTDGKGFFDMCIYKEIQDKCLDQIQPDCVLGKYAIDAAMDGATIVFEGDELPDKNKVVYYDNGHVSSCFSSGGTVTNNVIAYKLLEEKESIEPQILSEKTGQKHSHYFKDVSNLDTIDVYRICDLCEVDDKSGATQHAIKKLLCAGQRGAKDKRKDLEEARDTIIRKLQMMDEDGE